MKPPTRRHDGGGFRPGPWLAALVALCLAASLLTACDRETPAQRNVVARINDYDLSEDSFRHRVVYSARLRGIEELGPEDLRAYLEEEISKELLIQEATRRGIQKEASFRESIERYWEQTLITELLRRVDQELAESCLITEADIQAAYQERLKADPNLGPLDQVREGLRDQVVQAKRSQALEDWMGHLRTGAEIEVYSANLAKIK